MVPIGFYFSRGMIQELARSSELSQAPAIQELDVPEQFTFGEGVETGPCQESEHADFANDASYGAYYNCAYQAAEYLYDTNY